MINSNTGFGRLKTAIVGRELSLNQRFADISFKIFYKESIKGCEVYEKKFDKYEINPEFVEKRNAQLDKLSDVLRENNIKVYRPNPVNKVIQFKTPFFRSEVTSASNVRDLTLIYRNKIIETPVQIRNRYFENMSLYDIFDAESRSGGQWICPPRTRLTDKSLDLDDWRITRDFKNIPPEYEMAIDGAQFLRIGRDAIVNISTYNHWRGFEWIKQFFPETSFHIVKIADNHIDGVLHCLKPGTFLANQLIVNKLKEQLPEKFRKWNFICPRETDRKFSAKGIANIDIQLASERGMDLNVLSLDYRRVIVNKNAVYVADALEKNGFDVIQAELDNGEIFAGGIHCSTLDLEREDEYIFYE